MERVKQGEKYWYITSYGEVEIAYETEDNVDFLRFKANNYFPANEYPPKMVEEMAKKLRAVLKGADVIPNDKRICYETTENTWHEAANAAIEKALTLI